MANNDIHERERALWDKAEKAFRSDVSYAISLAEASSVARSKHDRTRGVVPDQPFGV